MMDLKEKQGYLWEFYKDCFGSRPRHLTAEDWADEAVVDAGIAECEGWLRCMKRTDEGRELLRQDGWAV
jgi:hypothetical protein